MKSVYRVKISSYKVENVFVKSIKKSTPILKKIKANFTVLVVYSGIVHNVISININQTKRPRVNPYL